MYFPTDVLTFQVYVKQPKQKLRRASHKNAVHLHSHSSCTHSIIYRLYTYSRSAILRAVTHRVRYNIIYVLYINIALRFDFYLSLLLL